MHAHVMEELINSQLTTNTFLTSDIYEQISSCLQLQNNSNKEDIITDLLDNGLQALKKYAAELPLDYLSNQELFILLQNNVVQTWETILPRQSALRAFYDSMKVYRPDLFNEIVGQIVDNGNKHKDPVSQILFLVLQLSFPYIANITNIVDILWNSITTNGINGLQDCEKYIAPIDLEAHLHCEQDETPLILALKEYFKSKVAEMFEKNRILNKDSLYDAAADAFTKIGWISGMEAVRLQVPPFLYEQVLQSISPSISVRSLSSNPPKPDESPPDVPSTVQPAQSLSTTQIISQQIADYLHLHDGSGKDQVLSAILKGGRQVFCGYGVWGKSEVLDTEKNWTKGEQSESRLLLLLKEYYFIQLQMLLEQSAPKLFRLIKEQKDSQNCDHFSVVQTRFAEYGTNYTGSSFVLSFVLQLLFEGITDEDVINGTIFARLFKSVTENGIHGAEEKEFKDYVACADLKSQIADEQSMLYLTLRMYFYAEIQHLFSQRYISNRNQRYELLADSVTKNGWLKGIEAISDIIPPAQYNILHQDISQRLRSLSITESPAIIVEPVNEPAADHSNVQLPQTTVVQRPQLLVDCELNEMFNDMQRTLEQLAFDTNKNSSSRGVWSSDEFDYQFAIQWSTQMEKSDSTKLLNDSIEYVHAEYYNQNEYEREKLPVEAISNFVEIDRNTLVQEWNITMRSDIVELGDKCVTQTQENLQTNSLISVENFEYMDRNRLAKSLSSERGPLSSTPEILLTTNHRNSIATTIRTELNEDIFCWSNILQMSRFCDRIVQHVDEIINNRHSACKISHEMVRNISADIKSIETIVNNELAFFRLQLSKELLVYIHTKTCRLLTVLYYQQRQQDLFQQYVDLDRNQQAFRRYFHELLTDVRKPSSENT
ncbi:unnamed protein product [Adineta ricciae]|uniref:Uncharacterized protein n=1 Tax=Adineta ricciae TaxID=249248 RepID=A0A813WZK5_ADIRI|nr:unnamed protein product [Adineta ricciae]